MKLTLEQVESLNRIKVGPEVDFNLFYQISDTVKIAASSQIIFTENLVWRGSLGLRYRYAKSSKSKGSGSEELLMSGYEEKKYLQRNTYFISFGSAF